MGIHSFAHSLYALSLKIAQIKEQPWAIHSGCSKKIEKIVFCLFVFDSVCLFMPKSKLLKSRLLFFKEQLWANRSGLSEQKSYHEWFPPVTLYKRATVRNLLPSLFTKERPWAIRSGRSWLKSDWSDSLFFMSRSLFHSQKTIQSLEKPMSEFPTQSMCHMQRQWISW